MTTRRRNDSGFTLVEILVTVAILAIVVIGVLGALAAFSRQGATQNYRRQANSNLRTALTYLEKDLRRAGWGMDPGLAFDFNVYKGKQYYGGNQYCTTVGSASVNDCFALRDSVTGPDEIVFYARNPSYWGQDLSKNPVGHAWTLNTVAAANLTLTTTAGDTFFTGQVMQVVCSGGTPSAYVTVKTTTVAAGTPTTVPLVGGVAGNPYSQDASTLPCATGGGRAFQIDRFHYYVDTAMQMADATTPGFLVLDRGIDWTGKGITDPSNLIPVAAGITDLQVAYVMPLTGSCRTGDVAGTGISFQAVTALNPPPAITCPSQMGILDFTLLTACFAPSANNCGDSIQTYPTTDAARIAANASNISMVDVAIAGRSISIADGMPVNVKGAATDTRPGSALQPLLNHNSITTSDALPYMYSLAETSVQIENTSARGVPYL